MTSTGLDTVRRRLGKAFDETDHPRDENGRWSAGDHAVDNGQFEPADTKKMDAIDARLDKHLQALHEAKKQVAEHAGALKTLHATIDKHHEKALEALNDHNDVLDEYGFENTVESEVDDLDAADTIRSAIDTFHEEVKPHLHASKLK